MNFERGITAIEVILALGLFTVVCGLLFTLLFYIAYSYKYNSAGMDAQYNARMVIYNINRDIRSASQIEMIDEHKIIIKSGNERFSYYLDKGTVYRHAKAKIPIAEKVLDLRFYQEGSLVIYSIVTGSDDYTYDLEMACYCRVISPENTEGSD